MKHGHHVDGLLARFTLHMFLVGAQRPMDRLMLEKRVSLMWETASEGGWAGSPLNNTPNHSF